LQNIVIAGKINVYMSIFFNNEAMTLILHIALTMELPNKYQYTTPYSWLPIPSVSQSLGNFARFLSTLDSL